MFRHYTMLAAALLLGAGVWTQATAASTTTAATPSASLQRQAAAGKAGAEVKLGLGLIKSKTPADQTAAVEWFRKAAAQGNTDGQFNLGIAYATDVGVTKDVPRCERASPMARECTCSYTE
jgi:TPR repeat protein